MKLQEMSKTAAVIAFASFISIATTHVYANEDFTASFGEEVGGEVLDNFDSGDTFTNATEANTEPLAEEGGNVMPLSREELLAEITQVCQDAATEEGLSAEDMAGFLSTCISENMEGLDSYEMASSFIGEVGGVSTGSEPVLQ